jgi:hypothetical protein
MKLKSLRWKIRCSLPQGLQTRLARMRRLYALVPEARRLIAQHQTEIDLYRLYAHCCGCGFFVMQTAGPLPGLKACSPESRATL